MKVIVFDLGGTLMEYKGMPASWVDFYESAFNLVNQNLNLNLSQEEITRSCDILTSFNPRINYREIEYSPEKIFSEVVFYWNSNVDIEKVIDEFFQSLELKVNIFKDTLDCVNGLKKKGYLLAILTDLPTAMSDEVIKKDIPEILDKFDLYVSSGTCGYRKPNKSGLEYIARYFKVGIEDILFIGDESKDINTAINAGCKSVLISRRGKDYKSERKNTFTLTCVISPLQASEITALNYGQNFTITDLSELHSIMASV